MGKVTKPNTSYVVKYEKDNTFDSEKFLKLRLRVCHDGVSPNKTFCTKEVMENAADSIEYIPILAHTIFDENGKPMFGAHDSHIEEDKLNPGQQKIVYDEIPIGLVPSNAENNRNIEEYEGRNYQFVDAYIWREYSNYCEQLLEDAVDSKLSMEISIPEDKLSYNAKEKYWDIAEYKYRGITMLNPEYGTGMKKALATTENFESNNDSLREKMLILMEQLQDCLRDYNNTSLKEGGETVKLNELLEKYGKTVEDITFEYENLSDEELEAKFAELFEEANTDEEGNDADPEPTSDGDEGAEDSEGEEPTGEDNPEQESEPETEEPESESEPEEFSEQETKVFSVDENGLATLTFKLSHEDVKGGLYNLLYSVENADNEWYMITNVYDDHFVYQSWDGSAIFGQKYTVEENNVAFSGERWNLHAELLTDSEYAALYEMRKDYALLKETVEQYKLAEENAQKDALFVSEDYSSIANKDEFKALAENHVEFSVDELKAKLDEVLLSYAKKNALEFSVKAPEKKKINKVSFGMNMEVSKPEDEFKPYGDLFDK